MGFKNYGDDMVFLQDKKMYVTFFKSKGKVFNSRKIKDCLTLNVVNTT